MQARIKWEIKDWLEKYGLCQVHTKRPENIHVPMGEMPLALSAGQYFGLDLTGPLVPSRSSQARYIMTCIGHDGWAKTYPLLWKTNEATWEKLQNYYILRFSVPEGSIPECIIMDQASEWKGINFK